MLVAALLRWWHTRGRFTSPLLAMLSTLVRRMDPALTLVCRLSLSPDEMSERRVVSQQTHEGPIRLARICGSQAQSQPWYSRVVI